MSATALQFEEKPFEYQDFGSKYGYNFANGEYNPNFYGFKISDALGLTNYAGNYEEYLADKNRAYEQYDAATARRFEEYMASTQYQRMKKDLEAAGMNPWLALQNGVSGSAGSGSVGVHASAKQSSKARESKGTQAISALAMMLMATAKMISVL